MASSLARRAAKALLLPAGLWSRAKPGDVVILLYHRIRNGSREIETDPGRFAAQMARLADSSDVVPMDTVRAHSDRRRVAITFDDGYDDFLDEALPILADLGLPATLYVPTAAIGGSGRLSWQALRDISTTGLVTIGSHTHNHANLERAAGADAALEMRTSKELIESELGRSCDHFAFPWAVASDAAIEAARQTFLSAARYAWVTNRAGHTDPHRLGRIPVLRSDSPLFFWAKARGGLDAEGWAYRAARRGPWSRALET